MPFPATTGQLRDRVEDMQIGDYIPCVYKAGTSGSVGAFGDIGQSADTEIPVTGSATPGGTFYFVKVDKGLLVADRVVQSNISWDTLNLGKVMEGVRLGGGFSFNGAGSYAQVPYNSALAPTTGITVVADVTMPTWIPNTRMDIVSREKSGGFAIVVRQNGNIFFDAYADGAYRAAEIVNPGLEPNSRHTLVGTYDGRYICLYIDGQLVRRVDYTTSHNIRYGYNNSLFVGCKAGSTNSPDTVPNYLNGTVHRVALMGRAATEGEVGQGIHPATEGLIGYWDFSIRDNNSNLVLDVIARRHLQHTGIQLVVGDGYLVRSLTGGVAYADENGNISLTDQGLGAFPTNNEWDKYITNFPPELIREGSTLNDVFHYGRGIVNWCQDTPILGLNLNGASNASARTRRPFIGVPTYPTQFAYNPSNAVFTTVGFRPVFEYRE